MLVVVIFLPLWLSIEVKKPSRSSFRSRLWCNMQYALCSRRLPMGASFHLPLHSSLPKPHPHLAHNSHSARSNWAHFHSDHFFSNNFHSDHFYTLPIFTQALFCTTSFHWTHFYYFHLDHTGNGDSTDNDNKDDFNVIWFLYSRSTFGRGKDKMMMTPAATEQGQHRGRSSHFWWKWQYWSWFWCWLWLMLMVFFYRRSSSDPDWSVIVGSPRPQSKERPAVVGPCLICVFLLLRFHFHFLTICIFFFLRFLLSLFHTILLSHDSYIVFSLYSGHIRLFHFHFYSHFHFE